MDVNIKPEVWHENPVQMVHDLALLIYDKELKGGFPRQVDVLEETFPDGSPIRVAQAGFRIAFSQPENPRIKEIRRAAKVALAFCRAHDIDPVDHWLEYNAERYDMIGSPLENLVGELISMGSSFDALPPRLKKRLRRAQEPL
jgi:hypothetical protein